MVAAREAGGGRQACEAAWQRRRAPGLAHARPVPDGGVHTLNEHPQSRIDFPTQKYNSLLHPQYLEMEAASGLVRCVIATSRL